jgi:hypothetical protein
MPVPVLVLYLAQVRQLEVTGLDDVQAPDFEPSSDVRGPLPCSSTPCYIVRKGLLHASRHGIAMLPALTMLSAWPSSRVLRPACAPQSEVPEEWRWLAGDSDVSWDSFDGPQDMAEGSDEEEASEEEEGGEGEAEPGAAGADLLQSGMMAVLKAMAGREQGAGPHTPNREGSELQAGTPGRQAGGEEEEPGLHPEDAELEKAFAMLSSALAGGKRPKVGGVQGGVRSSPLFQPCLLRVLPKAPVLRRLDAPHHSAPACVLFPFAPPISTARPPCPALRRCGGA